MNNIYINDSSSLLCNENRNPFRVCNDQNPKTNECEFSIQRPDAILHYLKYGGYTKLNKYSVSNLFHFTKNEWINNYNNKENNEWSNNILNIFKSNNIITNNLKNICGLGYLYPYQLKLAMNIPFTSSGFHFDSSVFTIASRHDRHIPNWLLIVMSRSGLFEHLRIPQSQMVLYLSNLSQSSSFGGEFIFHDISQAEMRSEDANVYNTTQKSAAFFDGTSLIHAVNMLNTNDQTKLVIDSTDMNSEYSMVYNESNQMWMIYYNKNKTMFEYNWNQIRVAIIYRVLCFNNEKESNDFFNSMNVNGRNNRDYTSELDYILNTLRTNETNDDEQSRYDLARKLIEQYVHYPK